MVETPSDQRELDFTITRTIIRIGGYLDLIPPLPETPGGQDIEVLKLFDRPRKIYIQSLANTAIKYAEFGIDPTRATEVALPHIDQLFSDHDKLDAVLSFALANHEFGNDTAYLLASATSLAERQRDAIMYAKLGEAQARFGIETTGFEKADARLAETMAERESNPLGLAVTTYTIEEVALLKLRAGHILSARQTIDRVPWSDWREVIMDRLQKAFETSEQIYAQPAT